MKDHYDREITYLRVSVTERCNLRCRYCMPEEGICKKRRDEMLTEDELFTAIRAAASLGVRKIRFTGGEPMVKRNILSICRRTADIPDVEEVSITTNATLLAESAGMLRDAGVDRINISLDTLDPRRYAWITRRGSLREALDGVEECLLAGFQKVKLNTVLIGGFNDDEIHSLAALTKKWPVDVRFIELMPMAGTYDFGEEAYISNERVLLELPELIPLPDDGGVAKLYQFPGAQGRVGLISPMSACFCGRCCRLRLTPEGNIKPCLHSGTEYPLKGLDEEEMKEQFRRAIACKPAWHGGLSVREKSHAGRRMNQIGG